MPDATRSGMIGSASVPDAKSVFQVEQTSSPARAECAEAASESENTSSDTDSTEGVESDPEPEFMHDPVVAPRSWGSDVVMYKNLRTQVVHVVSGGCSDSLLCGVKITQDFQQVDESPFLDIRKCKRCALKKPIKTVGQLASILGSSERK